MEDLKPFAVKMEKDQARQRLLGHLSDTVGLKSGQVILKPGEEVGEHNTENKEEVIVILEGEAEITSDKSGPVSAKKNSAAYIPPHTSHNVRNTGKSPLRYVYIVSLIVKEE